MEFLIKLLVFALVLGIVVGIHELGHYLAGRLFGTAVESFSIGFGRPVWEARDRRGTRWRINMLPLGGFVKFSAEKQLPGDAGVPTVGGLAGKPFSALTPGQRNVIALGGPTANFVLASVLFALVFLFVGRPVDTARVAAVTPGSPAAQAGFTTGDVIVAIDGRGVRSTDDVRLKVAMNSGSALAVDVLRDGRPMRLDVVPARQVMQNSLGQDVRIGAIGVSFAWPGDLRWQRSAFPAALWEGVVETGDTMAMSMHMLVRLITGREPLSNLKGPVGIADTTGRAIDVNMDVTQAPLLARLEGAFWTMIQLTALISVGIGLMNLLPLPILDGGHVVFNTWEMVSGRAVPEKVQELSLTFGMILLFGVAVVVTWHDIVGTGVLGAFGTR